MSSWLNSFVFILATNLFFALAQADCYFPDKSKDADGYPCNTTVGAVTHCCRTFEACLDNGVCYTQWDSQFYRRSCTDANWSDGCPTVCTDVARDGADGMLACSQGTNPTYCCSSNGSDSCCTASQEFNFIPGEFLGVLDASGSLCPPLPVATTITRTTTTIAQRETTSSNSSSMDSTSTSSATSAGAAGASETSAAPSSSSSNSSESRTIGLAVGIPLGVLLIASIAGLLWFFNRKLNQEKAERRRLEERLFSLVPANDPTRHGVAATNIWEKGDADRVRGPLAEIGPAEVRNEMPVDKATTHGAGSVRGPEVGTGTHSSSTTY